MEKKAGNTVFINLETDFNKLAQMLKGKLLVLPKNSGLDYYRIMLEELPNKSIIVRAEDVPLFVEKLSGKGVDCVGLSGVDLLKEYLLKTNSNKINQIAKIPWFDSKTLFGRPTLCLMGPMGKKLEMLDKNLVVAINSKYSVISNKFLKNLEERGFIFEKIFFNGATELAAKNGIADLVIDIVVSGQSAQNAGLKIYETIFGSDLAIIGQNKEFLNKASPMKGGDLNGPK